MPPAAPNVLKVWADAHGPSAVGRVVKRIERFSGNTSDSDTAAAAKDLVKLITSNLPKKADDAEA